MLERPQGEVTWQSPENEIEVCVFVRERENKREEEKRDRWEVTVHVTTHGKFYGNNANNIIISPLCSM